MTNAIKVLLERQSDFLQLESTVGTLFISLFDMNYVFTVYNY
jgi:hypothetical protein